MLLPQTEETFDIDASIDNIDEVGEQTTRKVRYQGISPEKTKKEHSAAGDILTLMQANYLKDPQPKMLGNLRCYQYKKGQPRIVIGPDFLMACTQIFLANTIPFICIVLPSLRTQIYTLFVPWAVIMGSQNVMFFLTAFTNPGLPPRQTVAHAKTYLNRVKTIE